MFVFQSSELTAIGSFILQIAFPYSSIPYREFAMFVFQRSELQQGLSGINRMSAPGTQSGQGRLWKVV